jgi:hypothetical protein
MSDAEACKYDRNIAHSCQMLIQVVVSVPPSDFLQVDKEWASMADYMQWVVFKFETKLAPGAFQLLY